MCLSKFLDVDKVEILVSEYHLDKRMLICYRYLKRLITLGIINNDTDTLLKKLSKCSFIPLQKYQ